MAGKVETVDVASTAALEQSVQDYVGKGFLIKSKTAEQAILEWKTSPSDLNFVLLFVLLLLCIIPGLIYAANTLSKNGNQVMIRVVPMAAPPDGGGEKTRPPS